jgi:hypothetical protein
VKRLSDQTLYELLEVRPDAPQDDVRAAIERARAIFGPGSLAMYSLMSTDEALLMNRRIEEAWATLLDPEARARYDASLVASKGEGATAHPVASWTAIPPVIPARHDPKARPAAPEQREVTEAKGAEAAAETEAPAAGPAAGPVAPAEAPPAAAEARKPLLLVQSQARTPPPASAPPPAARAPIRLERAVSVPPAMTPVPQAVSAPPRAEEPTPAFAEDTPWTGEMLRKVREARGLPLQIIAERTKVTRHHLENIEGDRFKLLPASVYLRGILLGLARELRLDGQKVARSYLERMEAALSPPPTTPGTKR